MASVLITGGTGMVGTSLSEMLLDKGYEVMILTRHPASVKHRIPGAEYLAWDVDNQSIDREAIERADHIIHLAGAGVAEKRWSEDRKREITESRTRSSTLIAAALQDVPNKVKTVVSASAIGWYGPDTTESRQRGFREDAPAANDFLGRTCRLWESSIEPVERIPVRLVKLRTGIVLGNKGGALAEFRKPLKAFTAAVLGNGNQVVSWIHIDDLCRVYLYAIENDSLTGSYNAVAPNPVTNRELVVTLAERMHGSKFITVNVPAWTLKIALGEMSVEVLKSATVSAAKIGSAGFAFKYPEIKGALASLES